MSARYKIGSVTGFTIPAGSGMRDGSAVTSWSVYDSAFCYRRLHTVGVAGEKGRRSAQEIADGLNAGKVPYALDGTTWQGFKK